MHWTYQITAASHPRVLLQLVQFFEEQSLVISALDVALHHQSAKINLTVEAESALAHRLHAELPQQPHVRQVELLAAQPCAVGAGQSRAPAVRRSAKANRSF